MSSTPTPLHEPTPASELPIRRRRARWIPRKRHLITVLTITALGLIAHRDMVGGLSPFKSIENRGYAMMGFDAYMQIIAARIQNTQDFLDTFTEQLTDGRIEASFYRPVQNLTIAADYAIWGLNPFGYHLSTLAVFGCCILLVYACTRRILGPDAWIGPTVAALFFALHPCQLNVLPSAARRSDVLVIVFLLLTLFVLPVTNARRTWPRILATGFLVLIAAGAKDVGVMGLGLVFVHQLFFRFGGGLGTSIWRAWLLSLPAAIGAGLYLINRTIVLKGFGGYTDTEDVPYLQKLTEFGSLALKDLLCPWIFWPVNWMPVQWRPTPETSDLGSIEVAIVSGCALLALAAMFTLFAMTSRKWSRQRVGILACIGVAWLVPPTILLGLMNWYGPWYTLLPATGIALILGAASQGAWSLLRGRHYEKLLGLVPATVIPVIMLLPLWYSPLRVHYTEWQRGSKLLRLTLQNLDEQIGDATNGVSAYVSPVPEYEDLQPPIDRPRISWVATINYKGIAAYAELRYPNLNIRAAYSHTSEARTAVQPNEVLIKVQFVDATHR